MRGIIEVCFKFQENDRHSILASHSVFFIRVSEPVPTRYISRSNYFIHPLLFKNWNLIDLEH